jgi:hypothetical protein
VRSPTAPCNTAVSWGQGDAVQSRKSLLTKAFDPEAVVVKLPRRRRWYRQRREFCLRPYTPAFLRQPIPGDGQVSEPLRNAQASLWSNGIAYVQASHYVITGHHIAKLLDDGFERRPMFIVG